ncbi:hypothetical protein JTB14_028960 [Gonioctena quinquepunctata]|nr:hypothetical protein JTB14_028960 [Gonioctena quinquepunctata]
MCISGTDCFDNGTRKKDLGIIYTILRCIRDINYEKSRKMTTKFVKRFKSIMAFVAILTLGTIVVVVWVQFSKGAFRRKQQYSPLNSTIAASQQEDSRIIINQTRHKELINKTHLEDIATDDVEFVKP